jgi:hypothetical protein
MGQLTFPDLHGILQLRPCLRHQFDLSRGGLDLNADTLSLADEPTTGDD